MNNENFTPSKLSHFDHFPFPLLKLQCIYFYMDLFSVRVMTMKMAELYIHLQIFFFNMVIFIALPPAVFDSIQKHLILVNQHDCLCSISVVVFPFFL